MLWGQVTLAEPSCGNRPGRQKQPLCPGGSDREGTATPNARAMDKGREQGRRETTQQERCNRE